MSTLWSLKQEARSQPGHQRTHGLFHVEHPGGVTPTKVLTNVIRSGLDGGGAFARRMHSGHPRDSNPDLSCRPFRPAYAGPAPNSSGSKFFLHWLFTVLSTTFESLVTDNPPRMASGPMG